MTESELKNPTIQCDQCNQQLMLDGESLLVRCASCGEVHERDFARSRDTDRMAWRSLWLGLASILLIFFTGIPAMYYGIRSLLRMRFRNSEARDRSAAIAGVGFGAFFGLIIGPCVAMMTIVSLAVVFSTERTKDPVEVAKVFDQFCELDLPEEFVGHDAQTFLTSQRIVTFKLDSEAESGNEAEPENEAEPGNEAEPEKRLAFVTVVYFGGMLKQGNSFNVKNMIQSDGLFDDDYQVESKAHLEGWTMNGQDVNVTHEQLKEKYDGKEFLLDRYTGVISCDEGLFGLGIAVRQPEGALTEEEVKAIFESCAPSE